jgi:hypothetical protein
MLFDLIARNCGLWCAYLAGYALAVPFGVYGYLVWRLRDERDEA